MITAQTTDVRTATNASGNARSDSPTTAAAQSLTDALHFSTAWGAVSVDLTSVYVRSLVHCATQHCFYGVGSPSLVASQLQPALLASEPDSAVVAVPSSTSSSHNNARPEQRKKASCWSAGTHSASLPQQAESCDLVDSQSGQTCHADLTTDALTTSPRSVELVIKDKDEEHQNDYREKSLRSVLSLVPPDRLTATSEDACEHLIGAALAQY